ncbi:MAG: class II glutamine amidotransferase [Gemmatimonadota bacterium]
MDLLGGFAVMCRDSREYQGHGWGAAWIDADGSWATHHSLKPIWEDRLPHLPPTRLFLAHARSAFRNEGIMLSNAMPFVGGTLAFAFNGEIRGVRLRVPGATGAWRLFNLLGSLLMREAGDGRLGASLERLNSIVRTRSTHVRGMNFVVSDSKRVWASSHPAEEGEYFTLRRLRIRDRLGSGVVVASEILPLQAVAEDSWESLVMGSLIEVTP